MSEARSDGKKMTDSHKQIDEALHEQSELLRVTLSSIGDAVITTDRNGIVTFLNSMAQSLTGWTQEDAAGKPLDAVFKIVSEESRRTVENPATRALREGVVVGLANHTVLITKNGTARPIDDSAAPIRNDKGEITGVVLVFRDISERRRQEQRAQDALSYAESIIATMREPFVVLDQKLCVKSANLAFYQTFHVSIEETEGFLLYDLGNGQWNIPRLRTLLEGLLANSHLIHDFDVEHDFPAIGKKIMLLNARRFESVDSRPDLILLAIEDITDRKQAELAIQTSEVRYRRLFETAQDGILILDANTLKIIDANPFMTGMLGYRHDEFLGKELWEIGLFGDKQASQAAYLELQQKGYIRYDHLLLETKNGEKAEVEFVSNVYQVGHRPIAQCNIRDISERSRLERKTHEQAIALVDLHRRKDEFLAMLSHELRNPLAPIMNSVQLLRLEGEMNGLQQQACAIIERQLGQLVHLVDDLLEVSRISTGRIHLRRERLDVRTVVQSGVETVRPLIEQRRHVLAVHFPALPIWIEGDSVRLEQVVVNLLNNAAKYTDERGHIWLTLQQEGTEAVLQVRDSGVGIAPELMPRIFDLFSQGERSLARSPGGLGIGLSLVQRLVELHGGKVAAFSALGHGSEFVVRLPALSTAEPRPPAPAAARAKPIGPSLRVLVVDDNVDTASSIEMLLKHSGHDVRTAHDGPTALEEAFDYRPNVVLLDIGLPGLNGFEIAKRLRQQPALQNVVLVAMSGYGRESDLQRSFGAGFDHHLIKPGDFGRVLQILENVLELPAR
jgi:PAS domain S-box-containing protein